MVNTRLSEATLSPVDTELPGVPVIVTSTKELVAALRTIPCSATLLSRKVPTAVSAKPFFKICSTLVLNVSSSSDNGLSTS